jgi:hypothetical protein
LCREIGLLSCAVFLLIGLEAEIFESPVLRSGAVFIIWRKEQDTESRFCTQTVCLSRTCLISSVS